MQNSISAKLYAGPKIQDELAKLSTGLELTVDYGFYGLFLSFYFGFYS
jgi:YidC/Oxa1 family membrane protein insertase